MNIIIYVSPHSKLHTKDGDREMKPNTVLSVDIGTKHFILLMAYKALCTLALLSTL